MKKIILILMMMVSFSLVFAQSKYIVLNVENQSTMINEVQTTSDSLDLVLIEQVQTTYPGLQFIIIDTGSENVTYEYKQGSLSGLKAKFQEYPLVVQQYLDAKFNASP